jgi:hypothetical protein
MMTNNDKMLAQFGADWVKVRDFIESLRAFYISYTPTFMVRIEKRDRRASQYSKKHFRLRPTNWAIWQYNR